MLNILVSQDKLTWDDWSNYEKAIQIAKSLGYDEIFDLFLKTKIKRPRLLPTEGKYGYYQG